MSSGRTAHRVKLALAIAGLTALGWMGACLADPGGPETPAAPESPESPPPPAGLVVSDPVPASAARAPRQGALSASEVESVVYVSLQPGTEPSGVTATVRALSSDSILTTAVRDGGFDPVRVAALVGDSIEVIVRDSSAAVVLAARIAVARARPPIVVRTDPPPKKRDVPLNSVMIVVFSEPIDATTLSATTVFVLAGQTSIAGQLEFTDEAQVTAALVPDAPLTSGTDYQLVVTTGIEDLDSDALEAPVFVDFTSAPPVASVHVSPDVATIVIGDTVRLTAAARDSGGNDLVDRAIDWASSNTSVASVTTTGLVTAVAVGMVQIEASVEGKADSTMITVTDVAVASVTVSPAADAIPVGDSVRLTALVQDGAGNVLTDRTITWSTSDSATATVSPVGLVRGMSAGSAFILVSAEGKADTATIEVTAPALTLVFSAQPTNMGAGQVITPHVQVTVLDTTGTRANFSGSVRIVLEPNPAGGALSGMATVSAVTGVATFSDLRIDAIGTGYRLTATADGIRTATSRPFSIVPIDPIVPLPVTGRIAFARCQSTGCQSPTYDMDVIVANADGSGERRLTTDTSANENYPAWRPDGATIAYTSITETGSIFVIGADGSGVARLTTGQPRNEGDEDAAWSRDGSRLVFVSGRDGGGRLLYVMNADGSGVRRLVNQPGTQAYSPTWSPDATKIAYAELHTGPDLYSSIYVLDVEGTGVTRLTTPTDPPGSSWSPAWSPDGTRIAFRANGTIWVMGADGSAPTALGGGTEPAWSPDGTRIAFTAPSYDVPANLDIYTMNVDGTGVTRLTSHPGQDFNPAWGPSGSLPPPLGLSVQKGGGDGQTDTVLATLALPLLVQVRRDGSPEAGASVVWSVPTGQGSVSAISTVTDVDGVASVSRTLGPMSGAQTAYAFVAGATGSPVVFTTTVNDGTPTSLVGAVATWTDVSGVGAWGLVNTSIQYYVAAADARGKGVRGVTLDWAVIDGGGTVTPAQSVTTDSTGSSTFPQPVAWSTHILGPNEGVHTVRVRASEVPGTPEATLSTRAVHGLVSLDQWTGFYPDVVTVPTGTTVAWIWNDGCCPAEHDVVFEDDGTEPVSSPRKLGGFHTRTFAVPGTYRYRCTNHSADFGNGEVGMVSVAPPIPPSRIAFTMMGEGISPGVYVMNADGSAVTRLTIPQGNEAHWHPAWSPDGRKIAFVNSGAATEGIWVANADLSGAAFVVAPPVPGGLAGSPTWSPDGAAIAFHTWHVRYEYNPDVEFNLTDIHSIKADGTGLVQILSEEDPGRWGGYPTWAGDGRVAFMSSHDSLDAIKVMNGDGSGQSTALEWVGCCISELAWSPDHAKIAFTVAYGTPDGNFDNDIYVIDADGSGLTRLTTNSTTREEHPSWSPDGTQIAFAKTVGTFDAVGGYVVSSMDIYVMNADGSGETRLTSGPGLRSQPAWSPVLAAALATGARR